MFAATRPVGITRNDQPIRVSALTNLSRALVATGFGYRPDRRRRQAEGQVEILPRVDDIRRMGGSALDLASVVCGRVDAFFEQGLAAWDVAAGRLLVTEAGGLVAIPELSTLHLGGKQLVRPLENLEDLRDNTLVIAAGPGLIDPLAQLLVKEGTHEGLSTDRFNWIKNPSQGHCLGGIDDCGRTDTPLKFPLVSTHGARRP